MLTLAMNCGNQRVEIELSQLISMEICQNYLSLSMHFCFPSKWNQVLCPFMHESFWFILSFPQNPKGFDRMGSDCKWSGPLLGLYLPSEGD